ncbi:MAG TPA: DUF4173 domain-containing protein [Gemmatimonadales bacterium]|jgi:hypothetical protein|nr:DUF4173 domain-containing protein [Gemmatimonadales bacterium]
MITTDDALARRILAGALTVGLAADLLLRATPLGVNVTLCTVLLVGVGAEFVRERGLAVSREARWLALTTLLLAFAFVRRDSRSLAAFDFLALIVTLGLTAATLRGVRLARLNIVDQVRQVVYTAGHALADALPLLARVVRSARQAASPAYSRTRAVILGTAIATPVLLGFGALFANADPVFGNAMRGAFDFDAGLAVSHVALVLFFSGLSAGYLSWAVLRSNPITPRAPRMTGVTVGAVPILTSLTLTVGLFGLFVAFQAGELFGGTAWVARAAGPSYAEYARSGFFELLAVAALVLPLLIVADRALGSHLGSSGIWFRVLARTLLALLFVIIVSALNRMRLYVVAYGLSEIRLYATAAMVYVTFLASWLGATLIRRRRRRFAPGALVAGYVALTGLHVINPDALIVRVNLSRVTTMAFDAGYAASLSADAIPTLLAGMPRLDPVTRCSVEQSLRRRWLRLDESQDHDWRALNWARLSEIRLARHWTSIPYRHSCNSPEVK